MLRSFTKRVPRRALGQIRLRSSRAQSVLSSSRDPVALDAVTTLSNGLRVATEAIPGHFSGIGIYVDAGSRYENERLTGVSHLVDRLAFKSTSSRSSDDMLESLESLGGNVQCASSRESIMYQAAVFNKDVANMMGILAETARDPLITEAEVAEQVETAKYEIDEIWAKPELILPELLHKTAYQGNTLGNPLLCPAERLPMITKDIVEEYRRIFYRPDRIVVAFEGVEHELAVKLTEKYFGDMKAPSGDSATYWETKKAAGMFGFLTPTPPPPPPGVIDLSQFTPSHYTGGVLTLPPSDVPTHLPKFAQLLVAFEALPVTDPEIYALATLMTLLGGGGSFSAGGPGKGMYSRLFTNVLNQCGWVESCVAFNHVYSDSALFGIHASSHPNAARSLLEVVSRELANTFSRCQYGLREDEVRRAKNQLRSSLLMNLESRMVGLENLGRQVQVHGRNITVQEMSENIEKLQVKDIRSVAERVFAGGIKNMGKGSGAATIVLQAEPDVIRDMGDMVSTAETYGLCRKKYGKYDSKL